MKPADRYYVRHAQSGQLGWLETHDGKQMVRLDRPNDPNNLIAYRQKEWLAEHAPPPLSAHQLGAIQHAADVALCRAMGAYRLTRKRWEDMKDEDRIFWMERGPNPERQPNRARLFAAIKEALSALTGSDGVP